MSELEQAKTQVAYLGGESIAFFVCDTCGWVDQFELPELPPRCPRCETRDSLVVQPI